MRVLITGSRSWDDHKPVWDALNGVCDEFDLWRTVDMWGTRLPNASRLTIVHGHCPRGADRHADTWAIAHGLYPERHPADWDHWGKRAGFVRNAEMVRLGADLCLAFIRDGSRGASMTADLAERAGIETRRIDYP